jgi:ABC-2 type transport system ATP-binding protein
MTPSAIALAVDNVSKSFRLPIRRVETLRERMVAGLRAATTELEVLRDISFQVDRGEFLGIVGRNGSGKSTLLKLVAGIYRPDGGEIQAAGRLAPIIELGVGFNNELEAYDNIVMNAVMMGLTPSEADARYPDILRFAELEDFEHLKLKNYSSGMRARLGFATMVHVDADLLLFDEVLAVGDAGFQQKCATTFRQLRDSGRTGVLVTHSMEALELHCDRALLLEGGRVLAYGEPRDVAREYVSLRDRPLTAPPGTGNGAPA